MFQKTHLRIYTFKSINIISTLRIGIRPILSHPFKKNLNNPCLFFSTVLHQLNIFNKLIWLGHKITKHLYFHLIFFYLILSGRNLILYGLLYALGFGYLSLYLFYFFIFFFYGLFISVYFICLLFVLGFYVCYLFLIFWDFHHILIYRTIHNLIHLFIVFQPYLYIFNFRVLTLYFCLLSLHL